MTYSKNSFIYHALVVPDLLALALAMLLAAAVAGQYETGFDLSRILGMRFSMANILGAGAMAVCWVLIFNYKNLYRPRRPAARWREILLPLLKATAIGALLFAALGLMFRISLITPFFIAILWPASFLFTLILRQLALSVLRRLHVGDHNQRNFLIVGSGPIARRVAAYINENAYLGYRVIGYLDDERRDTDCGAPYLGKFLDLPWLTKKHVIDEVVIAMPIQANYSKIRAVVDYAHELGVNIRFPILYLLGDFASREIWRVRLEAMLDAAGHTHQDMVIFSGYQVGSRYLIKRLFDLTLASLSLVVLAPVFGLTALAIWLTDGRPVFFLQDRYGYHGRVFKLVKFRTMIKNAEALQDTLRARNERDGAAFKIKDDPRITTVGRFLRQSSIDELPQLLNVLRGDMSLVGPRPLPLSDYERIRSVSHLRRLSVLPGITGTWQISGRDQISFEEWMQMDLNYIDEWRLSTDIKILLKTLPVVLLRRGAH